jgi:hypothetical protein
MQPAAHEGLVERLDQFLRQEKPLLRQLQRTEKPVQLDHARAARVCQV